MVTVVSVPVRVSIPVRVAPAPVRTPTPVVRTSTGKSSLNAAHYETTPTIINPAFNNAYWISRSSSGEPDKDGCISFLAQYDSISATEGARAAYDECIGKHDPNAPVAGWVLPLAMGIILVIGIVTIVLATNRD
ncbi:hypothetical protein D3C85_225390 [compost metagenome]